MTGDICQKLGGIHAATVVPMTADFRIDEAALERHVAVVAGTPGIRGLLVNGHAGENFLLSPPEKRRVVEISRATAPSSCLVCSGVNAESSLEAAREAKAAEVAGADVLLVFPPNSWALDHDEACVDIHHAHVRDATSLPLLIYGAPVGAGRMAYPAATLERLAAEPRIVGVKEGSWEVAAYEASRRLFKGLRPDFVVLGSGDEHLLASYMVGSEGSQVSLAAIAPELVVELHSRAEAEDWAGAREVHERIYPLAAAIYRDPPGGRATARLKACLVLLGRQASGVVRPPQPTASAAEIRSLARALAAAGLGSPEAATASIDFSEVRHA
jgi:4-hydroxy-tetrahydrodipicolinate synthase